MNSVEVELELFLAGELTALTVMLQDAELPPQFSTEFRKAIAGVGYDLRTDGQWRGEVKRAAGWDGHANAWDALAAWIKAHRPKGARPWWFILEYANGDEVAPEVTAFFGSK